MSRYSYFVNGDDNTGYWWTLVKPDGETLCRSDMQETKAACMKALDEAQRLVRKAEVIDEAKEYT